MKAKKINEFNEFKRGRDPKQALEVGLYHDNPVPELVELSEEMINNPEKANFDRWSKAIKNTVTNFPGLVIMANILNEFGVKVEHKEVWDHNNTPNQRYYFNVPNPKGGMDIYFYINPAGSGRSWHVWAENKHGWKHHGASFSWPSLSKRIKKVIRQHGN